MTPKKNQPGKQRFSFFGELRQRAAGGKEKRRASAMDIRVMREGEEGGVGLGVKSTPPPPPPKKKPSGAIVSFSCNIWTEARGDFETSIEECKQIVLEAGGTILAATYPGGFLYNLPFTEDPNPLDNLDETAGGGYITVLPYDASLTPHVHPLRAHPIRAREGLESSIVEHMKRYGLTSNRHPCNGRDKECIPGCEFRRTTRRRPVSLNARTWEDVVTSPVSNSPPQLGPTKRTSLIRIEDIFEVADTAVQTALSPQRLKRNSRNLSQMIEMDPTLTWLEDQETVRQFREEHNDGKAFNERNDKESRKRPRPTPIHGTVKNNRYVSANCRPPVPRRSSSPKQSRRASSEAKSLEFRRDSIVTAVNPKMPPSPALRPRTPLGSVKPYSPTSLGIAVQSPSSPRSDAVSSPMYSELSAGNIRKLQDKLTNIREGLGGT